MRPEFLPSEWGIRLRSITHETPYSVGVKTDQEDDSKVVSVPESFIALLTNFVMGARKISISPPLNKRESGAYVVYIRTIHSNIT